jgi:hypothetical protein
MTKVKKAIAILLAVLFIVTVTAGAVSADKDYKWFRCKKSGHFTKPVKNITNMIFICHKKINNDTKSNSYSLKRQ